MLLVRIETTAGRTKFLDAVDESPTEGRVHVPRSMPGAGNDMFPFRRWTTADAGIGPRALVDCCTGRELLIRGLHQGAAQVDVHIAILAHIEAITREEIEARDLVETDVDVGRNDMRGGRAAADP